MRTREEVEKMLKEAREIEQQIEALTLKQDAILATYAAELTKEIESAPLVSGQYDQLLSKILEIPNSFYRTELRTLLYHRFGLLHKPAGDANAN